MLKPNRQQKVCCVSEYVVDKVGLPGGRPPPLPTRPDSVTAPRQASALLPSCRLPLVAARKAISIKAQKLPWASPRRSLCFLSANKFTQTQTFTFLQTFKKALAAQHNTAIIIAIVILNAAGYFRLFKNNKQRCDVLKRRYRHCLILNVL